jgi:hypothetical protein
MDSGQPDDKTYDPSWGFLFRKPKKKKSTISRKERKRLKSIRTKIKR